MDLLSESAINIIAEGTRIEGTVAFDRVTRVHGTLSGRVSGAAGSTLVLAETALVEGDVDADTLIVDGYVRGDIRARTRVVLSRTARVVGNIRTRSLTIEFGAYFEGKSTMEQEDRPAPAEPSRGRPQAPSPA